jgi:hypothetical protein
MVHAIVGTHPPARNPAPGIPRIAWTIEIPTVWQAMVNQRLMCGVQRDPGCPGTRQPLAGCARRAAKRSMRPTSAAIDVSCPAQFQARLGAHAADDTILRQ